MDDEALIELARGGDRDAFAAVVSKYQDRIYTMALRIIGRPADAADVVQETFLRAFERLPALRGATVRSWLFRVAVNASWDVHRRGVRRPTDPLDQEDGKVLSLPDPAVGPEENVLSRERVGAIRAGLLALPVEVRTAVVLRDVNDLSYAEIAHALDIPLGTAKTRVARGRHALARDLVAAGVFCAGTEPGPTPHAAGPSTQT